MERCPNCRARELGTPHCRRCGMELGELRALEEAAGRLVRSALVQLAVADAAAAQATLRQAYALRRDPIIGVLLGFVTDLRHGDRAALKDVLPRGTAGSVKPE